MRRTQVRIKAILLIVFLFGCFTLRAEKVADLTNVMEPASIRIEGNSIYIPDREVIHYYTLEPFALDKSFGVRGEGPGEFNSTPHVKIYVDGLFLNCMGKIMEFTREGEFVHQTKLPFRLFYFYYPLLKVGKNYVGFPMRRVEEDNTFIHAGKIYDSDLKEQGEFYQGIAPMLPPPPPPGTPVQKKNWEVIPDCLDFDVVDDKIFISDSRKGFYIGVFDSQGKLLYEIQNPYEKIKVSRAFRNNHIKELQEREDWEQLKARFKYVFKKYFPAFFSTRIAGKNIYAVTYAHQGDKYEFVEMDLKGQVLNRSFSFPLGPGEQNMRSFVPFNNVYDVHEGFIYYLVYNDSTSLWEIHRTEAFKKDTIHHHGKMYQRCVGLQILCLRKEG